MHASVTANGQKLTYVCVQTLYAFNLPPMEAHPARSHMLSGMHFMFDTRHCLDLQRRMLYTEALIQHGDQAKSQLFA